MQGQLWEPSKVQSAGHSRLQCMSVGKHLCHSQDAESGGTIELLADHPFNLKGCVVTLALAPSMYTCRNITDH